MSTDSGNPQTRSKYASLAAIDRALRPIYTKHGFSVTFDTGEDAPENVSVDTRHCRHVAAIIAPINSTCRPMAKAPAATT